MHISKEFLIEAVGLSLLVALIFVGMQMFQRAMKITTLLGKEQEEKIVMLEEYELTKYDGLVIDGMTAISYIKKTVGGYDVPVIVEYGQDVFYITSWEELSMLRDINSELYISPYSTYRCKVIRDENGVVIEVRLVKE